MQQIQYLVISLVLLGVYAKILSAKPYKKKEPIELICWITAIECAVVVVMMEYAIDYWVLPAALDILIMAMAVRSLLCAW